MIRFNRKPGFFLTNPANGKRHLKAVVDITYDTKDHAEVRPLVESFKHLFTCGPIGPDDQPMKLGQFAMLSFNAVQADVPHANGNVYPEDVVVEAVALQPPAEHINVSVSMTRTPWWKRLLNRIGGRHG
jgi:hypothetical protein